MIDLYFFTIALTIALYILISRNSTQKWKKAYNYMTAKLSGTCKLYLSVTSDSCHLLTSFQKHDITTQNNVN